MATTKTAPALTPRLRLLADWVQEGVTFADIGTDHAYLPVWLRQHGRVTFAIASDLRKGPLERARETGRTYGVDGIDYRLANGLADVEPHEAEVIAIAGMGGETIAAILEAAPWTADGNHTLLLQPMTHAPLLRRYLAEHGFAITREALVYDRGTIYPVMEAKAGKMELSVGQQYCGAQLLHDPLGDRFVIENIVRHQMALAGARRSDPEKADALREILTGLLEWREEWRHANCP